MRHVENIVAATLEEMTLVLWYLKERHWVISDDKSSLQITVEGMDYLESNPPSAELVMPLIKASGLAAPAAAQEYAVQAPPDEAPPDIDAGEAIQDAEVFDEFPSDYVTADSVHELLLGASPTVDDPLRRANLNRILAR